MDATKADVHKKALTKGGKMILKGVRLSNVYKNGKRTDETDGLRVEVVMEKNGYETLAVKVADPVDRLTAVLEKADGPIYVDFTGFNARIYVRDNRAYISARADTVFIVDSTNDSIIDDGFVDLT